MIIYKKTGNLIEKQAKVLQRYFIKEAIQIVNEHEKGSSHKVNAN